MSEFWTYSVDVYGRPGVEGLCLELQDVYGLDVNCVLACCWAAEKGFASLSDEQLARIYGWSVAWCDQVVWPLRNVRRVLMEPAIPLERELSTFRDRVKGLELQAERLLHSALEPVLREAGEKGEQDRCANARSNLINYCRHAGINAHGDLVSKMNQLVEMVVK